LHNRLSEIEGRRKTSPPNSLWLRPKNTEEPCRTYEDPGKRKKFPSMKRAAGFRIKGREIEEV
jgi:hypothetical protein